MARSRAKRLALPRRFQTATTEAGYARLRALNARWGLSNNDLLTVLLEGLDDYTDPARLDAAFARFVAEYGALDPATTTPTQAEALRPSRRRE